KAAQPKKAVAKKQASPKKVAAEQSKRLATKVGSQKISVARLKIAKTIENREPVDAANQFSSDVTSLYCFSHIKGVSDTLQIQHRWYKGDVQISNVELPVRSPSWRTYSKVTLPEKPVGSYKVEILNGKTEAVMETVEFTVKN
ncbi:MAG: DUF2914 domain-containing protein, partial [Chitinivibrionales bacterium]